MLTLVGMGISIVVIILILCGWLQWMINVNANIKRIADATEAQLRIMRDAVSAQQSTAPARAVAPPRS